MAGGRVKAGGRRCHRVHEVDAWVDFDFEIRAEVKGQKLKHLSGA